MFRDAYQARRALMPIDGFFEWAQIKGPRPKQPHAIAMRDRKPFAVAALWEEWRNPDTGLLVKTFAIITCAANELIGMIHDRMPVIIAPENYQRWIGPEGDDPHDLLKPYPSALMDMWPISTHVISSKNDDPSILDPDEELI